jgi:DNA-binding CsgD family transcriptional regulator
MGFDPLDVIERAYDVEAPERAWLEGILECAAPALDVGRGRVAYLYDAAARPLRIWNFVGEFQVTEQDLIDVITSADDEYVAQSYLVTPFGTASERPGFDRQVTFDRRLGKHGIKDALALNAFDQSGLGAWVGALLPERRTVSEPERERWSKVSMHIAAALRLRARLRQTSAPKPAAEHAEAILSPAGNLEHAHEDVADAQDELAAAVRRLDHARGLLRKTAPDEAVDSWKVLVRARWSLVDHFESDGKRFILAYRNVPSNSGPTTLTDREREVVALAVLGHSPKLIAYDLGLAPSTVRVHLTNASKKLGVRTRAQLVAKYREWLVQQS